MAADNDILKQFGFENDKDLQHYIETADNLKVPASISKDDAWQKLEHSITSGEFSKNKTRIIPIRYFLYAAASIAIILGIWLGFNKWNTNYHYTLPGKMLSLSLPDGSEVTLNAASSLSWKSFRWEVSRKVYFEGEAFFKVRKGSRFEVLSNNNSITVVGTEFNVFSRKNYFEVKCFKGRISVIIPGEKAVFLERGQAVKKKSKEKPSVQFLMTGSDSSSWTNGEFFYNNADLHMVFDEIGRQFNIYIHFPHEQRHYSGFFRNTSLDSALQNVCIPMGLKFNISKDSVIIW
jgi:transmembrane sensor